MSRSGSITPEMVDAGKAAFSEWRDQGGLQDYDIEGLVTAVYNAMVLAAQLPHFRQLTEDEARDFIGERRATDLG